MNRPNDEENIVAYCGYCRAPIYEGEGTIKHRGEYYHYDPINRLNNCYFPEEEDIDSIR